MKQLFHKMDKLRKKRISGNSNTNRIVRRPNSKSVLITGKRKNISKKTNKNRIDQRLNLRCKRPTNYNEFFEGINSSEPDLSESNESNDSNVLVSSISEPSQATNNIQQCIFSLENTNKQMIETMKNIVDNAVNEISSKIKAEFSGFGDTLTMLKRSIAQLEVQIKLQKNSQLAPKNENELMDTLNKSYTYFLNSQGLPMDTVYDLNVLEKNLTNQQYKTELVRI